MCVLTARGPRRLRLAWTSTGIWHARALEDDYSTMDPTSGATQGGQAAQVCEPSDAAAQAIGDADAAAGGSSGSC